MEGTTVAAADRTTDAGGPGRTRRGRRVLQIAAAAVAVGGLISCTTPPGGPGEPAVAVATHSVANAADGSGRGTLSVDGCTLLGPNSVFTQRIDGLPARTFAPGADPVGRASSMMTAAGTDSLGSGSSRAAYQGSVYGMPLVTVNGTERDVRIGTTDYGYQPLPVFLAADGSIHWEGEPSLVFGDRHLTVLDRVSCTLQEHIGYVDGLKSSENAVQWSLPVRAAATRVRSDGQGPTNVEAAGLPIAPLVYRFDEVYPTGPSGSVGEIDHAVRIALPKDVNSRTASVWPAVSTDGLGVDAASMPMGTRLRLSATALARLTDDATVPAGTRAILTALNRYGAVVADSTAPTGQGGGFGLSGEYNPAWPAGVIESLSKVHAGDFEVVDVSCWQGTAHLNVMSPLPSAC